MKGGAFIGTGTATSYTVSTVDNRRIERDRPLFTLLLRSLCSIKKPAERAERRGQQKRPLSVPVSLSLSRLLARSQVLISSLLLFQILKSPLAPSRELRTIVCFFIIFLQFLRKKKEGEINKGRERIKESGQTWRMKHSIRGWRRNDSVRSRDFLRSFYAVTHTIRIDYIVFLCILQKQNPSPPPNIAALK